MYTHWDLKTAQNICKDVKMEVLTMGLPCLVNVQNNQGTNPSAQKDPLEIRKVNNSSQQCLVYGGPGPTEGSVEMVRKLSTD